MKIKGLLIGLAILSMAVIGTYLYHFFFKLEYKLATDPSLWGAFGDYIGGIINPLVGGAGLLLLLQTLKQNDKALDQSREMISQGNDVIKQNTIELKETREEQKRIADSQAEGLKQQENILQIELIRHELDERYKLLCEMLGKEVFSIDAGSRRVAFSLKTYQGLKDAKLIGANSLSIDEKEFLASILVFLTEYVNSVKNFNIYTSGLYGSGYTVLAHQAVTEVIAAYESIYERSRTESREKNRLIDLFVNESNKLIDERNKL